MRRDRRKVGIASEEGRAAPEQTRSPHIEGTWNGHLAAGLMRL